MNYEKRLERGLGDKIEFFEATGTFNANGGNCSCGKKNKVVYHVRHKFKGYIAPVGCDCIRRFEGENPATYEALKGIHEEREAAKKEEERKIKEAASAAEIEALREEIGALLLRLAPVAGDIRNGVRVPYDLWYDVVGPGKIRKSPVREYKSKAGLIKWYRKEIDRAKAVIKRFGL